MKKKLAKCPNTHCDWSQEQEFSDDTQLSATIEEINALQEDPTPRLIVFKIPPHCARDERACENSGALLLMGISPPSVKA